MGWDIAGGNTLVTGATSGIGMAVARGLAEAGARVTITGRDPGRLAAASDAIGAATGREIGTLLVDLASLASVREASEQLRSRVHHLDLLINNAGVFTGRRKRSVDGHELMFATNHLGPFLLTYRVLPLLLAADTSRVINTASIAHTRADEGMRFDDLDWETEPFRMMPVYGHSKLANILHAVELNERYGDQGLTAAAVHPGVVATRLGGRGGSLLVRTATRFGGRWMRSPEEGADTILWLATCQEVDLSEGCYFADRAPSPSTRYAKDVVQARRLWDISEELVGVGDGSGLR